VQELTGRKTKVSSLLILFIFIHFIFSESWFKTLVHPRY
jgi:hypothetical protein